MKGLGARVETVWKGLRPITKKMLVAVQTGVNSAKPKFSYDVQSDWELSSLLTALDEQTGVFSNKEKSEECPEIARLAETVATVLESQSGSAEVFIQLAERALARNDYRLVDKLADGLTVRFSAAEICEIVRQTENPAIRAIGFETLALLPTPKLLPLVDDPLYSDIVRFAIEQQAFEFDNEYARQYLDHIGFDDEFGE